MTAERRDDKHLRGSGRRGPDARGARPTGRPPGGRGRAFRPLRWAWLLLLVALLAPAYDLFLPAGYRPPKERRTVVIERGQSLHGIAHELQRVGIIRSQAGFLVLARMMHLDRSVKAGQYSFKLGTTVPALLRALDRGMFGLNLITIPEGLMVSETASLLQREVGIRASAIDSLAHDPMLLDSLGVGAPSLEGWLAPDSYEWLPGTSPEVVLRTMVARTRERVQRATAGYDSLPLGMNAHEVLTLASIVESESRAKEERPHIARVYLNRLDRGMLLQADPTVGYALGRGPRSRLTFKDLRVVSPYNTYRHEGLPPGPICSPGLAAIEAVMNATPGANDLYFVARGEGRHLFAPTYEQHLANIAHVRGKKAALAARTNPDAASEAEPDSSGGGDPGATAPVAANAGSATAPAAGAPLAERLHSIIKAVSNPPRSDVAVPAGATHAAHADSG
ncbi:MAG TPA: endolytic transglycosylase MltG, partial [Candidatus Eisenbacteria bacterium]